MNDYDPTLEDLKNRYSQITLAEICGELGEILPYAARIAMKDNKNSEDAVNVTMKIAFGCLFDDGMMYRMIRPSSFYSSYYDVVADYIMHNCDEVGGFEWEEFRW